MRYPLWSYSFQSAWSLLSRVLILAPEVLAFRSPPPCKGGDNGGRTPSLSASSEKKNLQKTAQRALIAFPHLHLHSHSHFLLSHTSKHNMHFLAIFNAQRRAYSDSTSASATSAAGTPVKSAKIKAAAGRKNMKGKHISTPVFVLPTAADRAAVHEVHKQFFMLSRNYHNGGALRRQTRVRKYKF
jgi:hypothetical protein